MQMTSEGSNASTITGQEKPLFAAKLKLLPDPHVAHPLPSASWLAFAFCPVPQLCIQSFILLQLDGIAGLLSCLQVQQLVCCKDATIMVLWVPTSI